MITTDSANKTFSAFINNVEPYYYLQPHFISRSIELIMPASSTLMNFIGNALGTNVGTLSTPSPDSNGWYCTNIVAAGNASYFNDAVAR